MLPELAYLRRGRHPSAGAGPGPPAPLLVRVVRSTADFEALREPWEELHRSARRASVFVSWPWQHEWWRAYRSPSCALRVLAVSDPEGRLLGVLPTYARREHACGIPVRVLRFVGTGADTSPDDLGPLLAPGREADVGRLLAEALARLRPEWDVLALTDLDPECPFTAAVQDTCARAGLATREGLSEEIAYLALPGSWEALLASMHRDRRWRMRSMRRKLQAAGAARFFVWDDAGSLDEAVRRLAELHRMRWAAAGRRHSFSSPAYLEFHGRVMRSCLERGWLRLYCLEVDGAVLAMYYCYRFRNRVFLMQGGFHPGWARLHPGHVLMGHAIEHAIGEGNEAFDFLRGEHRYKDELATARRTTRFVTAYGRGLRGRAGWIRRERWPGVRRAAASLLRRARILGPPAEH